MKNNEKSLLTMLRIYVKKMKNQTNILQWKENNLHLLRDKTIYTVDNQSAFKAVIQCHQSYCSFQEDVCHKA